MKSFKYTINGNVYKVHINSVVDDIAEVEVNGTPYNVKMEKPAKKQMVTLKRPAQAPTTASGEPVVTRPAASTTQGAVKTPLPPRPRYVPAPRPSSPCALPRGGGDTACTLHPRRSQQTRTAPRDAPQAYF